MWFFGEIIQKDLFLPMISLSLSFGRLTPTNHFKKCAWKKTHTHISLFQQKIYSLRQTNTTVLCLSFPVKNTFFRCFFFWWRFHNAFVLHILMLIIIIFVIDDFILKTQRKKHLPSNLPWWNWRLGVCVCFLVHVIYVHILCALMTFHQ